MLRRRRIPDLTGEQTVPRRIKSLDGTRTDRKSPADEWVVLGRPVFRLFWGILFRMLNVLVSHQEPLHLFGSNFSVSSISHRAPLRIATFCSALDERACQRIFPFRRIHFAWSSPGSQTTILKRLPPPEAKTPEKD